MVKKVIPVYCSSLIITFIRKSILLFSVLWLMPFTGATQIDISGIVSDAQTNVPLEAVYIYAINSQTGCTSDQRGAFRISLPHADSLRFSYLGYVDMVLQVDTDTSLFINLESSQQFTRTIDITDKRINITLPAPFMQIPRKDLERDNDLSIGPSLNRVPGVLMHSGALNTNRITIRGIGNRSLFATSKIRAYLDDIPLTDGSGETSIEDIDLDMLRDIKVWKGPTASNFGAGLGGMIQLRSFRKEDQLFPGISQKFSIGSYGLLRGSSTLNFSTPNNRFHLGLNYNHTRTDGYRDNNEYKRAGTNLFVKYFSGEHGITSLLLYNNKLKAFIPSSLNFDDYVNSPSQAAPNWAAINGFEDNRHTLVALSQQFKVLQHQKLLVLNRLSLFSNFRDSDESRPFNILGASSLSVGLRNSIEVWNKSQNQNDLPLITFGLELFHEDYDWKTFRTNQGIQGNLISDNAEDRKYLNVFVKYYQTIFDRLTIYAGANFNNTNYIYRDNLMSMGIDRSADYGYDWIFSPHIGINWHIDYRLSFFGIVSHGFSIPTLEETLTPDGTINPNINPEKGVNYEIGSRGRVFNDKLTYELSIYRMNIKDLLVSRRLADDQFIGLNAGKTRHQGLECFLQYQLYNSRDISLLTFLSYNLSDYHFLEFIENEEDFSGNELTGTPPHHVNIAIDLNTRMGFSVHYSHRFVDSYPIKDDNSIYSDAFQVSNVKLNYQKVITNKILVEFSTGIQNLFAEKYASMILINASSFGGAQPRYYYPGLPRNYFGSIKLEYQL